MEKKGLQRHFGFIGAILAICVLIYGPTLGHDFILLDDDTHLYNNPLITNPSLDNVARFWKRSYFGLYIPVAYTAWSIESLLAKTDQPNTGVSINPAVFHFGNMLLHFLNAVVVYFLLTLLTPSLWGPFLGAVLFVVHPMQVEPVAWASGFRDLLATHFALLALSCFLIYENKKKVALDSTYCLATLFFIGSMLSKPSLVMLPLFVGVLVSVWGDRPWKEMVKPLGIWCLLALPIFVVTKWLQPASILTFVPELWQRPLVALDALSFYGWKLLFPASLAIDYGRTPEWLLKSQIYLLSATLPVAFLFLIKTMRTSRKWWSLPILFAVTLLPVLGLVSFAYQQFSTVADHYFYFTMFVAALAVAQFAGQGKATWFPKAAGIVLTLLALRSVAYVPSWKNTDSVFAHTFHVNPDSQTANNNLAFVREKQGKLEEALAMYARALKTRPEWLDARFNVANILAKLGRLPEAEVEIRKVLELKPNHPDANHVLGMIYMNRNDVPNAYHYLSRAVELDPTKPTFLVKLGAVHTMEGKFERAVELYTNAISLNPNLLEAYNNLGVTYQRMERNEEAATTFLKAIALNPQYPQARANLIGVYQKQGKCGEAIPHFETILKVAPNSTDLRQGYATCLAKIGRKGDSSAQLALLRRSNTNDAVAKTKNSAVNRR